MLLAILRVKWLSVRFDNYERERERMREREREREREMEGGRERERAIFKFHVVILPITNKQR